MKARILKIVAQLKEKLRNLDEDGISNDLVDDIYDKLNQIEDEIYNDDLSSDSYEDENY